MLVEAATAVSTKHESAAQFAAAAAAAAAASASAWLSKVRVHLAAEFGS